MLIIDIPGREQLALEHLVLDQNGTLTDRGALPDGVAERLGRLKCALQPHLLSADTFGTLDEMAVRLGVKGHRVSAGIDKRRFVQTLGAQRCVAIGNGANDTAMLEVVALGIAVIGPEGASLAALRSAHVVCGSITQALDLLLDVRVLAATLRA